MRHPNHRCPDCHMAFYSAEAVNNHRNDEQGECEERHPLWKRNQITKYRNDNGIEVPPMPYPEPEFDVIED